MPAKINSELKGAILGLSASGLSNKKIRKNLLAKGYAVSDRTVDRVITKKKLKDEGFSTPVKKLGTQNKPFKRTPALIKKIDKATTGPNPASYRRMEQDLQVSKRTIQKVLDEDLGKVMRRKKRTHVLSDKQAKQRRDKGPDFLRLISRGKWKYIISIDESFVTMNDINGRRGIYYAKDGEKNPQSWTKKWKARHPKKVMFAAGISARGKTGMYYVPPKVKVDRWFFIDHILTPIWEKDIPRLYPGEEHKVVLHFDSAPSHVTWETYL